MLPLFMFAIYEKHGQPLEVILKHYIEVRFLTPKQRPYKTDNFYAVLIRQDKLDKEVKHIVERRKTTSPKINKGRKTENRRCHFDGKKQK